MDEISVSERMSDQQAMYERTPYLATHRALAACARELSRLSDELVARAASLSLTLATPAAAVRRPPGRCIIQLGGVALTAVWVQNTLESVATGELLIDVWRGTVSPRLHHRTERPADVQPLVPAARLWERIFTASADTEASWAWQLQAANAASMSSASLAGLCVEQLGLAYLDTFPIPEHA